MKFVKQTKNGGIYPAYADLWRLIRLAGFDVCEPGEIDLGSDETYVFYINDQTAKSFLDRPRKCRLILWHLERFVFAPLGYDEVWVSDRWMHRTINKPYCRYVPVGGDSRLMTLPKAEPKWDFVHMASLNQARSETIDELKQKGYSIAPVSWGTPRDTILSQSRMGLLLHQDATPIIEPLRYTLFACWQLPLVRVPTEDAYPYLTYGLDEIAKATDWKTNYDLLTGDMSFRKCVEAML